ncbi:MAG TPA: hypothetical protein VMT03_22640 [Polyangia bacterium]|nr:hypothetical protein [Polyangia bacterium]
MTTPQGPEAPSRGRIDLIASLLMAAATLSSAWCAFQASVWNGVQTRVLAMTSVAQFSSARQSAIVNRNVGIDVGLFLRYVDADLHGDQKSASFLRANARREFRPAMEAWIRDVAATGREDAELPFFRPEYHLAAQHEIEILDAQVAKQLDLANAANSHSDMFVLHTVLFALSLMFLGGVAQARRRRAALTTVTFGALAFAATFGSMLRLPRAHPNRDVQVAR